MTSLSITELAKIISENTAKVDEYLATQGLPQPSFDVNAPSKSLIPSEAVEIEAARAAVIDATLMLRDLMLGPKEYLMSFTVLMPTLQQICSSKQYRSTTGS
jgi:hypothetical protein